MGPLVTLPYWKRLFQDSGRSHLETVFLSKPTIRSFLIMLLSFRTPFTRWRNDRTSNNATKHKQIQAFVIRVIGKRLPDYLVPFRFPSSTLLLHLKCSALYVPNETWPPTRNYYSYYYHSSTEAAWIVLRKTFSEKNEKIDKMKWWCHLSSASLLDLFAKRWISVI